MTDNSLKILNPLTQKSSQPQLSMPGPTPDGDTTDQLKAETMNSEPYDGILTWGSELLHTAYIVIDDVIPANEFKRYSHFVRVHRLYNQYSGIILRFRGMKPSIYSLEDIPLGGGSKIKSAGEAAMAAGAVEPSSVGRDSMDLLNKAADGGGVPFSVDTVYQIELLPLQCERACISEGGEIRKFNFTNGSFEEFDFPCVVNRDLYVAFDVINRSFFSSIIRFDVQVLMKIPKTEKESSQKKDTRASRAEYIPSARTPAGRVSSARPNGVSGTVPIGYETNALDVISDGN